MENLINTVLMDLPASIHAYVVLCPECPYYYTIVINSMLSLDAQRRAYLHEMHHINNGDFFNRDTHTCDAIETDAEQWEEKHAGYGV